MRFTIYDETGRLTQSNKVYSPEGYDKHLHELGHKFVAEEATAPRNLVTHHFHQGEIKERPLMAVSVSKAELKAGTGDAAVFRGIPPGTRVTIETGGMRILDELVPSTEMEISIPIPCIYKVTLHKWPHQDFVLELKALA